MKQNINFNIINFKEKIQTFFVDKPVKKAYLFGSFARNMANEKSDIDILVELDTSKIIGLIEFIKLTDGLQLIFNKKVDLVSTDGVSKHILPFINKDKILIYEA